MRRHTGLLVAVAVVAASCSTQLGRSVPECDDRTGTLILQIQSVPGAALVPCIVALPPGWDYDHLVADSSGSTFWLSSDRLGSRFLTVETLTSCDRTGFTRFRSDQAGTDLFKSVEAEMTVSLIVIPEGQSSVTEARAVEIVAFLRGDGIAGRTVDVGVDAGSGTTAERIEAARRTGAHVIAVSIRDAEDRSLSLALAGEVGEDRMDSLEDAVEAIEDVTEEPTYRGSWIYAFTGGCVVYTFDAAGPEVATIEEDVAAALDLFDVEPLREDAREAGFRIP